MSLPPFVVDGVAFVISALFETSVFGSGVGWTNTLAVVKVTSATINLITVMLAMPSRDRKSFSLLCRHAVRRREVGYGPKFYIDALVIRLRHVTRSTIVNRVHGFRLGGLFGIDCRVVRETRNVSIWRSQFACSAVSRFFAANGRRIPKASRHSFED